MKGSSWPSLKHQAVHPNGKPYGRFVKPGVDVRFHQELKSGTCALAYEGNGEIIRTGRVE
eukprot:3924717-Amphidinium_carterae.2